MENLKDYGISSLERLLDVAQMRVKELADQLAEKQADVAALAAELAARTGVPPSPVDPDVARMQTAMAAELAKASTEG